MAYKSNPPPFLKTMLPTPEHMGGLPTPMHPTTSRPWITGENLFIPADPTLEDRQDDPQASLAPTETTLPMTTMMTMIKGEVGLLLEEEDLEEEDLREEVTLELDHEVPLAQEDLPPVPVP
ncbi:hypothetical protein JAAARDRAFT_197936 [Jaapia argillacea MUCL 33604]|uniref:Uncharacterized protein n=1 Tax=Jaapia argillacea MUCL 33604 TaxID=933084 RepID=A0A067PDL5_9AGAM|nr:hypothetical protein JAAARDRAFT_197936 [Jaapia argillacea MUCL 33604]